MNSENKPFPHGAFDYSNPEKHKKVIAALGQEGLLEELDHALGQGGEPKFVDKHPSPEVPPKPTSASPSAKPPIETIPDAEAVGALRTSLGLPPRTEDEIIGDQVDIELNNMFSRMGPNEKKRKADNASLNRPVTPDKIFSNLSDLSKNIPPPITKIPKEGPRPTV